VEGIDPTRIFFVGNIMIDSLIQHKDKAISSSILTTMKLSCNEPYAMVTLHRPYNVDLSEWLGNILGILEAICKRIRTVFPLHPRTYNNPVCYGLIERLNAITGLISTDPVGDLVF
jgi:UDP-N-acetylglucosamine 2-epimerase (non-hydrolysing)